MPEHEAREEAYWARETRIGGIANKFFEYRFPYVDAVDPNMKAMLTNFMKWYEDNHKGLIFG